MSDDDNVKVAVRVRPFNKREKEFGATRIIFMEGKQTKIVNPETGDPRPFTFDYSYDSFDDTRQDPNYATQDMVYNDLGVKVLGQAWAGYNSSIFAYGQTGSGKSYSMMGYNEDVGIIPMISKALFDHIADNANPADEYCTNITVEAEYMEIYNEQVRDLFNPANNQPGGLKVREHPKMGPYVDGLSRYEITNFEQISNFIDQGQKARTVAATQMNDTSSRSHSLFCVFVKQTTKDQSTQKDNVKTSKINLIDLAGSERAASTGATGDRLKEGSAINKSLSALGNVIGALADAANNAGNGKKMHIPYRDSALTWLLRESLGGNAKTIMVAALSPHEVNYDETLSTLKYADRAKSIKNVAVINEDPKEKLIRELRDELEKLRAEAMARALDIQGITGGGGDAGAGAAPAPAAAAAAAPASPVIAAASSPQQPTCPDSPDSDGWGGGGPQSPGRDAADSHAAQKALEEKLRGLDQDGEERMQEQQRMQEERMAALNELGIGVNTAGQGASGAVNLPKDVPHLVNLNEDPLMSECLIYFFPPGETRIGRKDAEKTPDIVLSGLNIEREHALVVHDEASRRVTIEAIGVAQVFVNGNPVDAGSPVELHQSNRVIMGNNHIFRFNHPHEATQVMTARAARGGSSTGRADPQTSRSENLDWQYAQRELANQQGGLTNFLSDHKTEEADLLHRMDEAEEGLVQQLKDIEGELVDLQKQVDEDCEQIDDEELAGVMDEEEAERSRAELREPLESLQGDQSDIQQQLDQHRMDRQELQTRQQSGSNPTRPLEDELVRTIPMLNEANAISKELGKNTVFQIKLKAAFATEDSGHPVIQSEVVIQLTDMAVDATIIWTKAKFQNRIYLMRDVYQRFLECRQWGHAFTLEKEDDPFYDPEEDQQIGWSHVYLESLTYLIDIDETTPVLDYKGKQCGELRVIIRLSDDDAEQDFSDDAEALVGKALDLTIELPYCNRLPSEFASQTYIKYKFFGDAAYQMTERCTENTVNPEFAYSRRFTTQSVTRELVQYLASEPITLEVWGRACPQSQMTARSKSGAVPKRELCRPPSLRKQRSREDVGRRGSTDAPYSPSSPVDPTAGGGAALIAKGVSQYCFLISVDIHEFDNGGYEPVQKKFDAQNPRGIFRLRANRKRQVVISFSKDEEDLIVTQVSSVCIARVRSSSSTALMSSADKTESAGLKVISNRKFQNGNDVIGTSNKYNTMMATAVWDATDVHELLTQKSKGGDRVCLTMQIWVHLDGLPDPICFSEDIMLKIYGQEEKFGGTFSMFSRSKAPAKPKGPERRGSRRSLFLVNAQSP